ncbi:unnamed protein product [Durusdinium trenchii]|uniref:Secreted protein n=1 Tax=Durusdinium trenchii TaxID=1381693 RepID=A0ABP0MU28_9DINO
MLARAVLWLPSQHMLAALPRENRLPIIPQFRLTEGRPCLTNILERKRWRTVLGLGSLSLWSRGRSCRKCVAEDIEVECLFYCLARVPSGFERVSVIVGPDATRVMFIDRSPACRGSMPDMKLGMTLSLSCLSYAFTWPCEEMCCVRKSSVELPDGSLLEFHDQGAFAAWLKATHASNVARLGVAQNCTRQT